MLLELGDGFLLQICVPLFEDDQLGVDGVDHGEVAGDVNLRGSHLTSLRIKRIQLCLNNLLTFLLNIGAGFVDFDSDFRPQFVHCFCTHSQVVQDFQTLLDHFRVLNSELHSHEISGISNVLLQVIKLNLPEVSLKLGCKSGHFLCITLLFFRACGGRRCHILARLLLLGRHTATTDRDAYFSSRSLLDEIKHRRVTAVVLHQHA